MYLDPASSLGYPSTGIDHTNCRTDLCQELWARVCAAFPSQTGSTFRLEQSGGDHLLLIIDEHRAFRFPRLGKHGLSLEIEVLDLLQPQAQVAIPAYDLIDPNGDFAAYPLIAGLPLTPERFSALPMNAGKALLADATALLNRLHSLEPRRIRPMNQWPRLWTAEQFAERIANVRLPLLAGRMTGMVSPIIAFLDRYRADRVPRYVVLHGDLVGDHMLIEEGTGRLAGIIDFSDVSLGDPAYDLLGFWAFGAKAADYAARCYSDAGADPTLLARSHRHFVRYEIDRLYEMIVDDASSETIERQSAEVIKLIAAAMRADPITGEYYG